jgi:UDP-N-acetylglucosamine 2-epimerase (non-hydrolysing)
VKIVTVLGTRPEIIRLSCIIPKLDEACEHVLVHTGQNFDRSLSELFFDELGLREPDHHLGIQASHFGDQIGQILTRTAEVFAAARPDRLLLLGDTNSALCAIVAKRMGVKVYHMEAGNRCFDDRVPEEVNRRVIDHSSDVLMPYTDRSRHNLLREGIEAERVFVTGNPILEVINRHASTDRPGTLERAGVSAGGFVLVTLHRAENVDDPARLQSFLTALRMVRERWGKTVLVSTHPRTRQKLHAIGASTDEDEGVRFVDPFGFPDFITLQRKAFCVLTDSGTVQEESCLFGVPNVTLRDATERQETVECGSNILAGANPDMIMRAVQVAVGRATPWTPPPEYRADNVSDVVLNILLSYRLH